MAPSKSTSNIAMDLENDADNVDSIRLLLASSQARCARLHKQNLIWKIASAVLLAAILGLAVYLKTSTESKNCILEVSVPSPVTRDLEVTFTDQHWDMPFYVDNIYRMDGSPEVDAAWDAISVEWPMRVAEEDGAKYGIEDHVRIAPHLGGGYVVEVEALHQVHCLNLIRKSLYFNYEYYHSMGKLEFEDDEKAVKKHVGHCLDMMRRALMCNADIGVLPQVWTHLPGNPRRPMYTFSRTHKCRNYWEIKAWVEARRLPLNSTVAEDPRPGDRIITEFHEL